MDRVYDICCGIDVHNGLRKAWDDTCVRERKKNETFSL